MLLRRQLRRGQGEVGVAQKAVEKGAGGGGCCLEGS